MACGEEVWVHFAFKNNSTSFIRAAGTSLFAVLPARISTLLSLDNLVCSDPQTRQGRIRSSGRPSRMVAARTRFLNRLHPAIR